MQTGSLGIYVKQFKLEMTSTLESSFSLGLGEYRIFKTSENFPLHVKYYLKLNKYNMQ